MFREIVIIPVVIVAHSYQPASQPNPSQRGDRQEGQRAAYRFAVVCPSAKKQTKTKQKGRERGYRYKIVRTRAKNKRPKNNECDRIVREKKQSHRKKPKLSAAKMCTWPPNNRERKVEKRTNRSKSLRFPLARLLKRISHFCVVV